MKKLLVVAVVMLGMGLANAAITTQELKTKCDVYAQEDANPSNTWSSQKAAIDSTYCSAYVIGWGAALPGYGFQGDDGKYYTLGWAEGTSPHQSILVFLKYVNENPAILNKPAEETLFAAVGRAGMILKFPVPTKITAN